MALGVGLGAGFGLFHGDTTLPMLGMLGIVTLFLFAGLEVDFDELRKGAKVLGGWLVLYSSLLAGTALLASRLLDLEWRPAMLFAAAIFSPSGSFIMDSLNRRGASPAVRFWVRSKAIAAELVSLLVLFVVVQSGSVQSLAIASAALVLMVAVLPWIFRGFVSRVLPYAPKSEFTFLVILALVCAYVTRHLGVYYLVGAFVVGVTAVRLRRKLPALASERLMVGIELFASFFIPLYFFKVGLHLEASLFTLPAIALGLGLIVVVSPVRVGVVALYRKVVLREPFAEGVVIGSYLVPTLVFTVVISGILREQFLIADWLYGALVIYALCSTLVPSLLMKSAPAASPILTPVELPAIVLPPPEAAVDTPAPVVAAAEAPAEGT